VWPGVISCCQNCPWPRQDSLKDGEGCMNDWSAFESHQGFELGDGLRGHGQDNEFEMLEVSRLVSIATGCYGHNTW